MADKTRLTRAEQTRQRRTQRQQKEKAKPARAKNRTQQPLPQPKGRVYEAPTMIRGLNSDLPLRKKETTQPRRVYNVSLGTPGAEIKLPYMPVFQPSWKILSSMLMIALAAGLYYLWNAPSFQVSEPFLDGATYVTAREINLVLGLNQTPVFSLNPSTLRRELMMVFPVFSDVDVRVEWPNRVHITVQERIPEIVWQHANGVLWVDVNGVAFPAPKDIEGLPIVLAPEMILTPQDNNGEVVAISMQQAYQLMTAEMVVALKSLQDNAPTGMPIFFDSNRGYGWQAEQGWNVYFGSDLSNLDAKLLVYQGVLEHLESEKITPQIVSVEYVNAPYYRLDR